MAVEFEAKVALWNFSWDSEADQALLEHCCVRKKRYWETIEGIRKDLKENPPKKLSADELLKLAKPEVLYLYEGRLLKKEVELGELLLILRTLDAKLSLFIEHVAEPWPGFFAHVGVRGQHPLVTPPPQGPPWKPRLTLVKR